MCCLSPGILWGHENDSKVSIKNINEAKKSLSYVLQRKIYFEFQMSTRNMA
jgi:hypothetical protein